MRGDVMRGDVRGVAAWALAAIGLGCLHLIAAGAPTLYPLVNAVAGIVGLAAGYAASRGRWQAVMTVAAGLAVLATALFGLRVDGIARWVAVGPVRLQPGLILAPALVVGFARRHGVVQGVAVALALAGLALSPDRGTAGAVAAGLVAIAIVRPGRAATVLALLAVAAFCLTLTRPDPLAPVAFVEQLFAAARGRRATTALLVAGVAAMLAPGLWAAIGRGGRDPAAIAFVAVWAALLIAATIGAYPTPVLGYGASGVLGYALALVALGGGTKRAR